MSAKDLADWIAKDPSKRISTVELASVTTPFCEAFRRSVQLEHVPVQRAVGDVIRAISEAERQMMIADIEHGIRYTKKRIAGDQSALKTLNQQRSELLNED